MWRTLWAARLGVVLDSKLSDAWFEVISEHITGIWPLEIALVHQLREDCKAQILEARQQLADSEGLLRRLRDDPQPHPHAVDRFFDARHRSELRPELPAGHGGGAFDSVLGLMQAQLAWLASIALERQAARDALHDRQVIERAEGLLMPRLGMSEEATFRTLQETLKEQNRWLLDVVEATLKLPDFAFTPAVRTPPVACRAQNLHTALASS